MAEQWSVKGESYSQWQNRWADRISGDLDLQIPSVRNLVFLALLEKQGEECSYDDLQSVISGNDVIEGSIPKENLRVAVLELRGKLSGSRFRLQSDRRGRDAVFQLSLREEPDSYSQGGGKGPKGRTPLEAVKQLESPSATPAQLAWTLIRDRALDYKQLYVLPRSASSWMTYSESETFTRRGFEHDALDVLFSKWLKHQTSENVGGICLLGLNVGGEGDAELLIIADLLSRFPSVHYLAIDLSGKLLADHLDYLNHHFGAEIKDGRLVCAVKAATFEDESKASAALDEVRGEFLRRFPELGAFFPETYPLLCSYLSNYIGNTARPGSEWDTFRTVLSAFPRHVDHAFFVGFASVRRDSDSKIIQESYPKDWFDFLAQTPRELLYNTKNLSSEQPPDTVDPEFKILSCTQEEFDKLYAGRFVLTVTDYSGAGQVRGQSYRFSYITRWPLSTEYEGRRHKLEAGTELQLYNIVKFIPETLAQFLRNMGLSVELNAEEKPIGTGLFEHRYQLLAAISWSNRAAKPSRE